ncbi:MAG: CHAT domain-containing protein, partial [Proteobacteria bacterium]|nr:CHAT domain-containing protein [Pseudomonadota bacterium]
FKESLSLFQDLPADEEIDWSAAAMISVSPPPVLTKSRILCNYGDTLCNLDRDLQEARAAFEEAISIQEGLDAPSSSLVLLLLAKSLSGLGRVLYLLGCPTDDFSDYDYSLLKVARGKLEEALDIEKRCLLEQIPFHIPDHVLTLDRLSFVIGALGDTTEAKSLLEEAVEICKNLELWISLAEVLQTRATVEAWETGDNLAGVAFAEQAINTLEKGLGQLSPSEKLNRHLFKGQFELSYTTTIAHYAQRSDPARVFNLLESVRRIARLTEERFLPIGEVDLARAQTVVARNNVAYLAIQVIPDGMVFFAILPSGRVEICPTGKGWRAKFSVLFKSIDRIIENISQETDEGLLDRLREETNFFVELGSELFGMLPPTIQTLFTSDIEYVFLSPYAELQNLPFEFLHLPTGEWLGLKRLLPRVHSFAELQMVLQRQPDRSSRLSLVVGDPRNDLTYAREAAVQLAAKLKTHGFESASSSGSLVGDMATEERFLNGLNSGIVLGYYSGHGGYDNRGGFLALAGEQKVRSSDVVHLFLTNHPFIHYDCCHLGIAAYYAGGQHTGFAHATIDMGASCCLLANRYLFDELATPMSRLFYDKLFEEKKMVGEALLETRVQLAEECPNPLAWAFSVLYGNPNVDLQSY